MGNTNIEYDQRKEAEAFEKTKAGVKGLVDAGVTQIPRMFHHPPESLIDYRTCPVSGGGEGDEDVIHSIPVIDMSNVNHDDLVNQMREAATEYGFFQVINHCIPVDLLDRLHDSVKAFHELPVEDKSPHYRRDIINTGTGFGYYSNHDLLRAKAACWRDTISVKLGPAPLNPDDLPAILRDDVKEFDHKVKQVAADVSGLLAEGLGLKVSQLQGRPHLGRISMMGHYYPYCPEPNKTVGNASHTDLGMLTVLLQDKVVGGLQVNHQGKWINLESVHGALVINLGDLFQILSNDKYKSGEHRVYANPLQEPRISIATFFHPGSEDAMYGPLPELISPENPARYKTLKFSDVLTGLLITESKKNVMANFYRL